MHKMIIAAVVALGLVGCATPAPQEVRKDWVGENEVSFNKDYSECKMKADDKAPGAGTWITSALIWPVGVAMAASYSIESVNTMKLCMAGRDWSAKN